MKEISLEQYLNAKKIIDDYIDQKRLYDIEQNKKFDELAQLKIKNCGEHYFLARGKWQSGMQCQDCGMIIN